MLKIGHVGVSVMSFVVVEEQPLLSVALILKINELVEVGVPCRRLLAIDQPDGTGLSKVYI